MDNSAGVVVPLPARTAVAGLALRSVRAASRSAALLAGANTTTLSAERIAVAYSSERHLRVGGHSPEAFAPLSGFFRTADGWVRTHGNYPHHAAALRQALALDSDADKAAAAAALSQLAADTAAARITAAGGLCVAVRGEARDVDVALRRSTPLVATTQLGAAPLRALTEGDTAAPLRGIRILDLTRVIAGPVCTRTLALLGADVLRIDSPRLPELPWQHLDTGHGKRSALLDLEDDADRVRFEALLSLADAIVLGYRPAGLDRLGLSPGALVQRHPGLIVARLSAWGEPDRRGFDSLVQAATGIAMIEARADGAPGALPAQALDHSAGYLLAAAVMELLAKRADEGGSWFAETSLRRVAAELLGMPRTAEPEQFAPIDAEPHLETFDVAGTLVTTTAPAIDYEGGPTQFIAPHPWGSDEPVWRAE